MPQFQLRMFHAGVTEINTRIARQLRGKLIVNYICGHLPVCHYEEQDVQSLRCSRAR
jgi:hypothetical protein